MPGLSVLRVNAAEEQASYRNAVAEILRRIQSDHEVTLLDIAERIDVSLATISNAANKKSDLNSIYLGRLGKHFGASTLDPYLRTIGVRGVPLDPPNVKDVLPFIQRAALRIAEARDPASPCGPVETLKEQADYLPDLRALLAEVGSLICRIEARRDAA
jgi:hypothetical protein